MMSLLRISLGTACMVATALASAAGQTSTSYAIPRDTLNAGVANMRSASFNLASSVGDAIAGGTITSVSFQLNSGFRATVNVSPTVLNLLSVVSRKIHGATPFSLTIAHGEPLSGNITIEPRVIGSGHTLVFHFDSAVTSVAAAATALDTLMNSAGNASAAVVNSDVVVTLNNVADKKRLTVTVAGINGSGTAHASMGFLLGDVNNTRSVDQSDVSAVKSKTGQAATTLNFQFDVNTSGAINAADIATVKARSGSTLSP